MCLPGRIRGPAGVLRGSLVAARDRVPVLDRGVLGNGFPGNGFAGNGFAGDACLGNGFGGDGLGGFRVARVPSAATA
jgi:hypothetical protein